MFAEKKRYYWILGSEPTKLNKEIWFPLIYSINSPKIFGRFCLWGWGMHDSSLSGPAMQTSRLTHWEIVWKITNYLITYDNPGLSPLSGFSDGPRHIWRSWRSSHLLWSQIFPSWIHIISYPDIQANLIRLCVYWLCYVSYWHHLVLEFGI